MKAWAIKGPSGDIDTGTISGVEDTAWSRSGWFGEAGQRNGYRCVPVEITELGEKAEVTG